MGRNAFWWPSIFSIVCACIFTNISWMNFLEWIMYEGFKFEKDFTTLCPCPVSTLIHKCQVINIKRLWSLTRSQKPNLVLTYFLPSFETQKWKYDTKCNIFFVTDNHFLCNYFFLQFCLLQICLAFRIDLSSWFFFHALTF